MKPEIFRYAVEMLFSKVAIGQEFSYLNDRKVIVKNCVKLTATSFSVDNVRYGFCVDRHVTAIVIRHYGVDIGR